MGKCQIDGNQTTNQIWWFPKIWGPPVIIHVRLTCSIVDHPAMAGGTPARLPMETPILLTSSWAFSQQKHHREPHPEHDHIRWSNPRTSRWIVRWFFWSTRGYKSLGGFQLVMGDYQKMVGLFHGKSHLYKWMMTGVPPFQETSIYGGFQSHGGTPIAGWCISWKSPI